MSFLFDRTHWLTFDQRLELRPAKDGGHEFLRGLPIHSTAREGAGLPVAEHSITLIFPENSYRQ